MTCERAAVPKISWELHSALSIGALATATPCARLHARNVVCEWGLHDIADAVELVVSELVTNAVKASIDDDGRPRYSAEGGLAYVHLRLSSDRVMTLVEVWDENTRLPVPTRASLDDDSGRGLMLVAALSQQWGWDLSRQGTGKIVWALIEP
jgi:anti-sigma regulatory factor (Ser/Thr protein kinase)